MPRKKVEAKEEVKKTEKAKNKGGRPTKYTEELADRICEAIATSSAGLNTICKQHEDFPDPDQIYTWILKYSSFHEKYTLARQLQQEVNVDAMLSIADDDSNDLLETEKGWAANMAAINRARLKIDTRKWHASKLAPKKYGDKIQTEVTLSKHEDFLKELIKKEKLNN